MDDPATDFRGNTVLVFEMLEALRRHAPECRFLLLSSAAVYGDPEVLPVTEGHAIRPISPYGYHKRQAELLCEEFSRIYGLPTVGGADFLRLRPGAAPTGRVGHMRKSPENRRVRTARHRRGKPRFHPRRGCRPRLVGARGGEAAFEGEIYNLASGREVTIAEVANYRPQRAWRKGPSSLRWQPLPPGNPLRWRADISKIAALGFVPTISFEQGIAEVAGWAKSETHRPLNLLH